MSDVTIYRNNLKTGCVFNKRHTQKELFEYCRNNSIIGGGWKLPTEPNSYYDAIISGKNGEYKKRDFSTTLNCLGNMKENDLVWTRCDGIYYLCRVKSGWEYDFSEQADDFDMHQIARVYDFVEIGTEENVPRNVLNSFRGTLNQIYNVDELSMYLYDYYSKNKIYAGDYPNIENKKEDTFLSMTSPKEMECIVALYLQKEKDYLLYSDTNRKSTPVYEYVLVKKDGDNHLAYVQVKTGKSLDATDNNYIKLTEKGKNKVYLFTVGGSHYGEDEGKKNNIFFISKEEIIKFVNDNPLIMPEKIRCWLRK